MVPCQDCQMNSCFSCSVSKRSYGHANATLKDGDGDTCTGALVTRTTLAPTPKHNSSIFLHHIATHSHIQPINCSTHQPIDLPTSTPTAEPKHNPSTFFHHIAIHNHIQPINCSTNQTTKQLTDPPVLPHTLTHPPNPVSQTQLQVVYLSRNATTTTVTNKSGTNASASGQQRRGGAWAHHVHLVSTLTETHGDNIVAVETQQRKLFFTTEVIGMYECSGIEAASALSAEFTRQWGPRMLPWLENPMFVVFREAVLLCVSPDRKHLPMLEVRNKRSHTNLHSVQCGLLVCPFTLTLQPSTRSLFARDPSGCFQDGQCSRPATNARTTWLVGPAG